MKLDDEKERNEKIDKLIDFFKKTGVFTKREKLGEMMKKEDFHNKYQTEARYQEEQAEWLKKIKDRKK